MAKLPDMRRQTYGIPDCSKMPGEREVERALRRRRRRRPRAEMPEGERDQLDYPWNEPGAPFRNGDY